MGVSASRGSSKMRVFILSLVVVAVTGDAKPWTLAQVAAGEPVKNAIAEGRLHNIGVITNTAQAGVTQVGAGQTAGGVITAIDYGHNTGGLRPLVHQVPAVYSAYSAYHPYTAYYGKREAEAEPYTLAQVAAGQTAGGVITHGGGHPVAPHRAPAVYAAYQPDAAPLVYYG